MSRIFNFNKTRYLRVRLMGSLLSKTMVLLNLKILLIHQIKPMNAWLLCLYLNTTRTNTLLKRRFLPTVVRMTKTECSRYSYNNQQLERTLVRTRMIVKVKTMRLTRMVMKKDRMMTRPVNRMIMRVIVMIRQLQLLPKLKKILKL
jgi:hypothetical protein